MQDTLFENLVWATLMVAWTSLVHFAGIAALIAVIRSDRLGGGSTATVFQQGLGILFVVFGLFLLHTFEIWSYAAFYIGVGEFANLEEALYFSTSTFTTVGFGDITLDKRWRLFSAIESANGFLLIGWSTAFLVSVTARIRLLEAEFGGRDVKDAHNSSRD